MKQPPGVPVLLRNVPKDLHAWAKAEATRQGITLRSFLLVSWRNIMERKPQG